MKERSGTGSSGRKIPNQGKPCDPFFILFLFIFLLPPPLPLLHKNSHTRVRIKAWSSHFIYRCVCVHVSMIFLFIYSRVSNPDGTSAGVTSSDSAACARLPELLTPGKAAACLKGGVTEYFIRAEKFLGGGQGLHGGHCLPRCSSEAPPRQEAAFSAGYKGD